MTEEHRARHNRIVYRLDAMRNGEQIDLAGFRNDVMMVLLEADEPAVPVHERLADLLRSIGWASPCDAQWTNLRDALPKIKQLLAPQGAAK